MITTKKGYTTIKNFKVNKGAAINYFNNIAKKDYVKHASMSFNTEENGYCVFIIYKKILDK